jgi:uncharacterized metal-binding protein YceD (DUF177 family)
MKTEPAPLEHFYDLGDLTQAGSEVRVVAAPETLPGLAVWAEVEAVKVFSAKVQMKRLGSNRFFFAADLDVDLVQSCVVTLEPVESHISRHLERELHLSPKMPDAAGELTLSAGDEDVPETITSLNYDLAAPLLEEFSLAIDPYPRKEGAAFTPPEGTESAKESPFAVLKALKDRG